MKFSEFLEEMGYELTEYQKEMVNLFQKDTIILQIPRQNGRTALLKEYYKYELNKKCWQIKNAMIIWIYRVDTPHKLINKGEIENGNNKRV